MVAMLRKLTAEGLGTYALVFMGTGAAVVNDVSGGAVSHVGVALTFGLIVLALIQAIGDLSGCHINPAVTVGFWASGRFPIARVGPYVASQCLGAVAASLTLRWMFPEHQSLGATIPVGPLARSFVLEIILTFFLMFVVLRVTDGSKEKGLLAGVAIGGVVALEALFAGPICGASMNPARSVGPALVGDGLGVLWLYLTAPILGALLAVAADLFLRPPDPVVV